MLMVRRVEAKEEGSLFYECLENGRVVGKLEARLREAGILEIGPIESARRDVPRTLVAKVERDALSQNITTFYLNCRDTREAEIFEPAGYESREPGGLLMVKHIQ